MKESTTTIKLKVKTQKRLLKLGYMGESYDDVINRLIDRELNQVRKENKTKAKYEEMI